MKPIEVNDEILAYPMFKFHYVQMKLLDDVEEDWEFRKV